MGSGREDGMVEQGRGGEKMRGEGGRGIGYAFGR